LQCQIIFTLIVIFDRLRHSHPDSRGQLCYCRLTGLCICLSRQLLLKRAGISVGMQSFFCRNFIVFQKTADKYYTARIDE
jgi:hypothetical protein